MTPNNLRVMKPVAPEPQELPMDGSYNALQSGYEVVFKAFMVGSPKVIEYRFTAVIGVRGVNVNVRVVVTDGVPKSSMDN